MNGGLFGAETKETESNDYLTEEILADAKTYSDQAVIVLGNEAVESSDCEAEALSLTPNRRELIDKVANYFKNMMIIINAGNATELGILDEYDSIKSAVWAGLPGTQGCTSLAKVLTGEVHPSGRLEEILESVVKKIPMPLIYLLMSKGITSFRQRVII